MQRIVVDLFFVPVARMFGDHLVLHDELHPFDPANGHDRAIRMLGGHGIIVSIEANQRQ